MGKRVIAAVAATGAVASLMVGVSATTASAGEAGEQICDRGSRTVKWASTAKPWKITHAKGYEKAYSGGAREVTRSVEHIRTLSSEREITAGANAGFSVAKVLVSLDVNVQGTYRHRKDRTTTHNLTVKDTLAKKGQYYFYVGRRQASGAWVGYRCDGGTKWIKTTYGTAKSYGVTVDGAVRCGESVSRKSLAYVVKKKYC
ncbi:hypothetical protein [Streptomyces sp. Je 1-332]|uniref:hypothetical protein n=1 Tax=Streptomyces sp. Je 1-332 TaxID=3231270 RepID=UPI00345997CF